MVHGPKMHVVFTRFRRRYDDGNRRSNNAYLERTCSPALREELIFLKKIPPLSRGNSLWGQNLVVLINHDVNFEFSNN